MNTLVSPLTLREEHELISVQVPNAERLRRLPIVDRLSLRLGLWLLLRTQRAPLSHDHVTQQRAIAQERHQALAAHELQRLRSSIPARLL